MVMGQSETPNLNQEIVTVGERELKLKDAFKANFYPQEIDTIITKDNIQYVTLPSYYQTKFSPDTIAPARLKVVEPLSKLYPGYIKLGVGNYLMPLGEFYYGSTRNRKGLNAVHLKHFSSVGNDNDVRRFGAAFSDNELDFWSKRFLKNSAFSAHVFGNRKVRQYNNLLPGQGDAYLNQPLSVLQEDEQKIEMIHAGASVNLQSYNKKKDAINHREYLSFSYLMTNQSVQEISGTLNGTLEKYYNSELYSVDFSVDQNMYNHKDSSFKQNNTLIGLTPHISTKTEKVKVDLGLRIFSLLQNGVNYFYFFPNASFEYTGADEYIIPYVGLNGNAELNDYQRLFGINPYFAPISEINLYREHLNLYLGFRGKISDKSSYNLKVSRKDLKNAPIYRALLNTNDADNRALFNLEYRNYSMFSALAEYSLELAPEFRSTLQVGYNSYSMDNFLNLPELYTKLNAQYNLGDKFLTNLSLMYVHERVNSEVLNPSTQSLAQENLGSYVDLSIGFEYRYTRRLAAFLNFANITGQRYAIYSNYSVLGFNVLGGLNYSF